MLFNNRTLVLVLVTSLFTLGITTFAVSAAPDGLPPRPTPEPTPMPSIAAPAAIGGWIQVRVANASTQWVGVQWQDSTGTWQTVESWRGQFDEMANGIGKKTWWVDQSLFGAPSFRWVVYDPVSRQVLASSQPFTLPKEKSQTVGVDISLAP